LDDTTCHSVLQISSEYKRGNDTFRAHRNTETMVHGMIG
jgi:hypothetical protein